MTHFEKLIEIEFAIYELKKYATLLNDALFFNENNEKVDGYIFLVEHINKEIEKMESLL